MSKAERKIGVPEFIRTTAFISYVVGFIWFMWIYRVEDITDFKLIMTAWLVFWLLLTILNLKKLGIVQFGATLWKVSRNKTLSTEDKLTLMMQIIQEGLGFAADLSQLVNLEKKAPDELE